MDVSLGNCGRNLLQMVIRYILLLCSDDSTQALYCSHYSKFSEGTLSTHHRHLITYRAGTDL